MDIAWRCVNVGIAEWILNGNAIVAGALLNKTTTLRDTLLRDAGGAPVFGRARLGTIPPTRLQLLALHMKTGKTVER
jgi:hypothetical protein